MIWAFIFFLAAWLAGITGDPVDINSASIGDRIIVGIVTGIIGLIVGGRAGARFGRRRLET